MSSQKKEDDLDGNKLKCRYCCFNKRDSIYKVPFCMLRGFGIYDEDQSCSKFVEMKEDK